MDPIIATESLSKTFRGRRSHVHAVREVSLQVRTGELFGLFGPNGAGKTTLVRMLSTLLRPSSGSATVNGFSVETQEIAVRSSIGLVASDERSFYGRLNAWQNLAFYAALQNVAPPNIRERSGHVLETFGLLDKAEAPFQSLSTGQKQRLNMARALLHDPPILLLDEPTKSMDVQTADFVKELIRNDLVGRQGKTVIFISHELYEMDSFCDRVAILSEGRVQAVGTPIELARHIPRRAVYRLHVEGDAEAIARRWRTLAGVESIREVSRGPTIAAFDVALSDETSQVWLQVMEAVGACAGRVESYQRVDDASLRRIIEHFGQRGSE